TSGELTGSYLEVKRIWHHDYSSRKHYLAVIEDSKPVLLHLTDPGTQRHKQIPLEEFSDSREINDLSFSPCERFLLCSDEKSTYLLDTATGEILKTIKPSLAPRFTRDDGLLLYETENGPGPWRDLQVLDTRSCRVIHTLPKLKNM